MPSSFVSITAYKGDIMGDGRGARMKIGFIGLGNVGGKLAGSLIRNGHDVTVRDLDDTLVAEYVGRGAKSAVLA